jgi:hypothetical protein
MNQKKKIGLCVCYDTKNFGSQLQVYATQEMVEKLGYDCEIIRYKKKATPDFVLRSIPRFFNPYFVKSKMRGIKKRRAIRKYPEIQKQVTIRNKRFQGFVEQYFTRLSRPYAGYAALKKGAEQYDAFLTGSDQLWLPSNLGSHFYTQEFVPDSKTKIAYATSFGVSQIPFYQKKRTAGYLNRFQSLSSREIAGSKIIESLTGKKASIVCDPTLLFDQKDWAEMIPDRKIMKQPYIFCYFLGTNPEHRQAAEAFGRQTGLPIVTCPFLDNFVKSDQQFGDVRMFDMDAADFVNLIRHAEYVLTDSFHGSVFSILHHKKFITFNRFAAGANSRNSRIDSLCELLGLSDRRYNGDIAQAQNEVDYSCVEDRLASLREQSVRYLREALSKA